MRRRVVLWALGAALVAPPLAARASAGGGHNALAGVLFDLYAGQSVRLSIANALRGRPPGTEEVLTPHVPAMVKSLARHRDPFVAKMAQALQAHANDEEAGALLKMTQAQPPRLDDVGRRLLFEADATFRREAQDVIGAMTADIGLMIAATLGQGKTQ